MGEVAFECRSLGLPCEWALRAGSRAEIVERVREHALCAHKMSELAPDVLERVESAIHAA